MSIVFSRVGAAIGGALLLVLVTACGEDSPTAPPGPEELEFAEELGVDLAAMSRTSSGLYLLDEEVGDGDEVELGDEITVHYTGWFHDGVVFDATEDAEPVTFTLEPGGLIQGWVEGLPGMREGGRRLLVIPPELAYGPNPTPGRAWATLVFRVDLVEVR